MRFLRIACLSATVLLAACGKPPPFNATDLSGTEIGSASLTQVLKDQTGKPRKLSDYQGKVIVIFFGYTQCPDVCPTVLAKMRDVMAQLGNDAEKVQVVFVTIDPERDTQELLSQYVPAFHPSFVGMYGDAAATASIAKDFKVFYQKHPGTTAGGYTMDHSSGSYVIDAKGKLRLYLKHEDTAPLIAQDIKRLLAER
ncbi:MAG: SCO family protein [Rhodocyclaceae bacterium]|jgi:protein SCO1/2|nr:SCO family protein [Rhodocyclaceae bacterium]MBP7080308.1 SCO family protein [Rhodocyclaceae bacterium]